MLSFSEFFHLTDIDEAKLVRVNRVRHGEIQRRVITTPTPGYKVLDGKLVRMSPTEIRHRHLAQMKAARKRRQKMMQTIRKRKKSIKRRSSAGIK